MFIFLVRCYLVNNLVNYLFNDLVNYLVNHINEKKR